MFFSDAPHCLKLLRNWFLDGEFVLENGTILNSTKIRELLTLTATELSPTFKLGIMHLDCQKAERQNVALAAELFSHSTATALRRYFPETDREAHSLADFIELVNDWFDILNSYSPSGKFYKKAFGLDLDRQMERIDKMFETVRSMKCRNKKKELQGSLQIFQKGILLSIASLKQLYQEVKSKYSLTYILTHRLNQDFLENFFSQVRGRGGASDHPSAVDCLYRIRSIMLGKNRTFHKQMHTNTVDADPDEYLTATFRSRLSESDPNECHQVEDDVSDDEQNKCEENDDDEVDEDMKQLLEGLEEELLIEMDMEKDKKQSQCSEDGLEYIAGWIGMKMKCPEYKHTNVSLPSHIVDHSYFKINDTWVEQLSYGGLTKPSRTFLETIRKLEMNFINVHGYSFMKTMNIRKELTEKLAAENKDVPIEVIKLFAKSRIFMRCKYLNKVAKEKSIIDAAERQKNRKSKTTAQTEKETSEKSNTPKETKCLKAKKTMNKKGTKTLKSAPSTKPKKARTDEAKKVTSKKATMKKITKAKDKVETSAIKPSSVSPKGAKTNEHCAVPQDSETFNPHYEFEVEIFSEENSTLPKKFVNLNCTDVNISSISRKRKTLNKTSYDTERKKVKKMNKILK